jgi:predicted MFS family arabinose efflux permease
VPLLHRTTGLPFAVLLALVFLGALLDTPGATARQALLPDLAERAGTPLERANGAFHSLENAAALVGPLLAGLLVAGLGASTVLWLDAVSFAVSAALIARGVHRMQVTVEPTSGGYLADVTLGWRVLGQDQFLRAMTAAAVVLNLLGTPLFAVVLPVYAQAVYGSAAALGMLLAGFGGGMLAGSLLFGAFGHRLPRRTVVCSGLLVTALPLWALAALPSLPLAVAALALAGLGSGPVNPLVYTVLQERVPAALRGRVFGTILGTALVAAPLGMGGAGVLLETIGLRPTLALIAAGFLGVAGATLISPAFRTLDQPVVDPPDHPGH